MGGPDIAELAREWRRALTEAAFVPMPVPELDALLAEMLSDLLAAVDADRFDPTMGGRLGARLVAANLTDPAVLARTARVLGRLAECTTHPDGTARMLAALGDLSRGYTDALLAARSRDQELLQTAMADARNTAEVRFRVVFENAAVAIAVVDTRGLMVDANPTLCEMLGLSASELRRRPILELAHVDDRPLLQERIIDDLLSAGKGTVRLEVRYLRPDGSFGWGSWAATMVPETSGRAAYLLAVGEDTTRRREVQAELEHQARHDPLTGLPNRLQLVETVTAAVATAEPADRIGLGFVDLDGFKAVNDTYGHATGDLLLAAVADRLRLAVTGKGAMLARVGGDEFVVLVPPPCDDPQLSTTAESLLEALADPIRIGDHALSISASIGAVVTGAEGTDAASLLEAADAGLYQAKASGRNRWVLHSR